MNLPLLGLEGASAGAAAFGALAWISVAPRSQFWGPVHASARPRHDSHYALTFDDGPGRASTPALLDILGELNAPAAFFVIGANARSAPDLLVRMHAEGHLIANHSFDHQRLSMFRGYRYWEQQLADTDAVIEQAIGRRPAMFRPPMGVKTCFVMAAAARRRHAVITWSRRAIDGIPTTTRRILQRLAPRTQAGDVLILHDGHEPGRRRDASATIAAVKPLIRQLRERGLEPARLDALLGLPAYAMAPSAAAGWSAGT